MSDILITGDGKFPMDVQVPIISTQATTDVELSVREQMKPGIVSDDIDKTAFYASGVLVHSMGDITRHLQTFFPRSTFFRSASLNRFGSLI